MRLREDDDCVVLLFFVFLCVCVVVVVEMVYRSVLTTKQNFKDESLTVWEHGEPLFQKLFLSWVF